MKQFFLTLIAIFSLVACSSDDDSSSNNNEISQNLLGKWYFEDPSTNPTYNNSFTFTADGNVVYSYWDGTPGNNYDSETGTFSVEGDILTMVFPENVTLTFIQKVVFITDDKIEFQDTGVAGEDAYEGDYFREGYTPEPLGDLKVTFTGSAFTDQCATSGNFFDVKVSFISDGNTINEETYSENSNVNLTYDETLSGDILKVKAVLQNFNPNDANSGKGTGISDITIKIEDLDGNVILEENIGGLLICMDTWYEVEFTFNKADETFNSEFQTHGF